MSALVAPQTAPVKMLSRARVRPRLGFLGVGWIGRHRLEAIAQSGAAEIVAVADTSAELAVRAVEKIPQATALKSIHDLLHSDIDGVVIATPSALHAEQAIEIMRHGKAVFCQKPLGRDAKETGGVIAAAREMNVLLGVDLSYRFMSGVRRIHELCRGGELGEIYAAELVFHNAYGPDKSWFYDRALSGGGCVVDLGIHLVDLALWNLGFPRLSKVTSRLYAQGRPPLRPVTVVEDYAEARLDLETGATVRIACSWKLAAGREAIISGAFYGTKGGAAFRNVDGSFYNFKAERFEGTKRFELASAPEEWGGRAAVHWAEQLAQDGSYDPEIEHLNQVAAALDAIYSAS